MAPAIETVDGCNEYGQNAEDDDAMSTLEQVPTEDEFEDFGATACDLDGRVYGSGANLSYLRDSKNRNLCFECATNFQSAEVLEEHLRSNIGCTESRENTEDDDGMPALEMVSSEDEFEDSDATVCDLCGKGFGSEQNLIYHDNAGLNHFCFKCQTPYQSCFALFQHLRESRNHNFCSQCAADFLSAEVLQDHVRSLIPRSRSSSKCTDIALLVGSFFLAVFMGMLTAYMLDHDI